MKKNLVILLIIFVLAYSLRVVFLPNLALTFGYDQARDAIVSQQILSGDLKVLGPPSSTPGLYHGVFYYYVLAIGYLIGSGSPLVAAYWIAFLNSLTVVTVFYLTYLFTKKVGAALVASSLFAISFEATQYAVWLSNPTIGIWTVPLIYLGLWVWLKEGKIWGALLAGLGLGLSVQAEIFLLYHIIPVALWLWVEKSKIQKRGLMFFVGSFLIFSSTLMLSEAKFGFRGISGVGQLLINQDPFLNSKSLGDFIVLYLNQLGKVFAFSSYPGNIGYGGAFTLGLIVYYLISWRGRGMNWQPFLATWLFSHITVVSVGGTSTPFLLVGIGPAVSILLGIFIYQLWQSNNKAPALLVLTILLYGNLKMIFMENPKGQTIFSIQKEMTLKNQLPAIDFTYQSSGGKPFSIRTLTSPLDINIVWAYLYNWYGRAKYNYLPQWWGPDQIGQLLALQNTTQETKLHYFIIEPMGGIKQTYLDNAQAEVDDRSKLVEQEEFGYIIAQKRERKIDE